MHIGLFGKIFILLFFKSFSIRVSDLKFKKIEYSQLIGLNLKINYVVNFLLDTIMITIPFVLSAVIMIFLV